MRDLGLIAISEPFTKLLTQGMVLNEAFVRTSDQGGREYFWEHDLDLVRDDHAKVVSATAKSDGLPVTCEGWTTMSKSKNNGVDPQALIERYGADTARLFVMFASPPEQTLEWNDAGVEGANRFLRRVWAQCASSADAVAATRASAVAESGADWSALDADGRKFRREVHLLLKQASYDYERMQYNTVVSAAMKLLNQIEAFEAGDAGPRGAARKEALAILLRVLYPACPHITHALWQQLGFAAEFGDLLDAPWPAVDEAALRLDEIELMLQISGKLRGVLKLAANADKATIEAAALASAEFTRFADGRPAKKVVIVPGRLVNVVV
jgi:leucyl-tRNA synthetase